MGLDIFIEASDKNVFYENFDYFNEENEIPFNERCGMRMVANPKNEDEFLYEISMLASETEREVDNGLYTIFDKEDFEILIQNKNLTIEALEAVNQVLNEVNFDREVVTIYPWW